MAMNFENFDVDVLAGRRNQLWVSARSRLGAVYAVPRPGWPEEELREAGTTLRDAVLHADVVPEETRQIGKMLQEVLFGDPEVLALFQRTRGAAADLGRPLIVRVLGAPHEIAALPWELILDPEGGSHEFLTLAPAAHVIRCARARTFPIPTRPIEPPLHILLVLSSPEDNTLPFDLYEEKRSVLSELAPLVHSGRITVDVEERPSMENLRRCISRRTRGYHVVHYLGHASQAGLILETRMGTVREIDAVQFTRLLHSCPELRLVVYAGCLTAGPPLEDEFESSSRDNWKLSPSIADLSVRVAAPAVIGMQAVLPFPTQRIFARFFYSALASGRGLADAVQLARTAIRSDEFVGSYLDWAVPSLFVAGADPGPVLDISAPATPVSRPVRRELKLGLEEEEERSLFARPSSLRQAVNVVSGRSSARTLVITGAPGLRTPFVARVLDDLTDDVSLVLYVHAREFAGAPDPVLLLCEWVTELLTGLDGRDRQPQPGWNGATWWKRVLEEITASPAVLVFDGLEDLSEIASEGLRGVFRELTLRSGQARLVLAGLVDRDDLLDPRAGRYTKLITLRPLEWESVFRWIRWNFPELLRHEDRLLACYKAGLQDDLTLWTRLAEKVASQPTTDPIGHVPSLLSARPEIPDYTSVPPLRAALAHPDVAGKVEAFADWITTLASDHKVGGRVLTPGRTGEPSPIAELLPVESPFTPQYTATDGDTLGWVNRAVSEGTNVLLFDFGRPGHSEIWNRVCSRLKQDQVLLIGIGGDTGDTEPNYPGWCKDVLTVGALANNQPARSATWDPAARKPELFAPNDLAWADPPHAFVDIRPGSYQAALGVLAAALLVWSVDRSLDAEQVRKILLDTARQSSTTRDSKRRRFRALDLDAALARARTRLLVKALEHGPASRRELVAAAGLSRTVTRPLLEGLLADRTIRVVDSGDEKKFELSDGAAAA
ncbi:CHAT domain-containing protein [Streptomyces sp. NPDC056402]|uniref:CHAT domain-containing protein n=1 Tax=Streptomyces sp. NPDC056402 TaxID=3345810 RepID=UPI0035D579EE